MRLSSFFSALIPSFLTSKKSQSDEARFWRSNTASAPSRQAGVSGHPDLAAGAEEAIARMRLQPGSERQRAIAARERTEKQWQRQLPEVPTHVLSAEEIQDYRRAKWIEQAFPSAPTHRASLSPSDPAKKTVVSRQRPSTATSSASRISKGTIKKLIADKRQKLAAFATEREAMRNELNALMSANKRKGAILSPTERLIVQQKTQALMKTAPAGAKLLAEIHALEQKLRVT